MKLLNNVDLEYSFEKLKKSLKDISKEIESGREGRYPYAYGRLSMAVILHLTESTSDETMEDLQKYISDPDDLKDIKFS